MIYAFLYGLLSIAEGILLALACMALHEFGHFLAARAVGVRVKRFGISWKGFYIVREQGSPLQNLIVSLAGSSLNLLFVFVWPLAPFLGKANLVVGLFNLLPIPSADGKRVLACLRQLRLARKPAYPEADSLGRAAFRSLSRNASPIPPDSGNGQRMAVQPIRSSNRNAA